MQMFCLCSGDGGNGNCHDLPQASIYPPPEPFWPSEQPKVWRCRVSVKKDCNAFNKKLRYFPCTCTCCSKGLPLCERGLGTSKTRQCWCTKDLNWVILLSEVRTVHEQHDFSWDPFEHFDPNTSQLEKDCKGMSLTQPH